MKHNTLLACTVAVALSAVLACSKNSESPTSPAPTDPSSAGAYPDGSTLKANPPTPQSPTNNAQPDNLVLTAGKATAKFNPASAAGYAYQFAIRNSAGNTVCSSPVIPGGSDSSVSWTPSCNPALEFDTPYTWRIRATYLGANSSWSADASFRSAAGGYIRGDELFDPLTNGKTVGQAIGTQFTPDGIELLDHGSRVTYQLPVTLREGEFSLMAKGYDEGSPGDKTKIMSMQEGGGDITTNDYRMTVEKRGRSYSVPGAVTYRIITGGGEHSIFDGARFGVGFSDERWYFWRFSWRDGSARLEVREDGPRGRAIYDVSVNTHGRAYKPETHVLHLGAPIGRAGPIDASIPGTIYKNVWASSRPRPVFPGE